MKHLKQFNNLSKEEKLNIQSELDDILLDLKDDGFYVATYFIEEKLYIDVYLDKVPKSIFRWDQISNTINRLFISIKLYYKDYQSTLWDKNSNSHYVEINTNNKLSCISKRGSLCNKCELGYDINNEIVYFTIIIYT